MLNQSKAYSKPNKQQGVALILCLILAAIFAAISIYTSEKEKQNLAVFMGLQQKIEQNYIATTIMQKLHYAVLSNSVFMWEEEEVPLNGFGELIELPYPDDENGYIRFTIQDTAGLLVVNQPSTNSFIRLIEGVSEDTELGEKVIDAWYDWEDTDTWPRIRGKEQDISGDIPYTPRNDKMQVLSELRLVENVEQKLFDAIEPHIVFSRLAEFNPKLSSNELRKHLGLAELSEIQRSNEYTKLVNGLFVERRQSFKIRLDIKGSHARFQRQYVVTYRPDEVRLVSISEFGD